MRTMTRRNKTTLLYVLLCVGTAAAAFLCVLISSLLLKTEEDRLYGRPGVPALLDPALYIYRVGRQVASSTPPRQW